MSQRTNVRDKFDASSQRWEDIYGVRRPWCGAEQNFLSRLKHVQALISDCRGDLLDVGCGTGLTTLALYHAGVTSICGIDFAPSMIERANRHAAEASLPVPVEFKVLDAEATGFPNESFDVITAMGVLEYVDDPAEFMSEMARLARPNAVIVITVPNRLSLLRSLDLTIMRTLHPAARLLKRKLHGHSRQLPSEGKPIRHTSYTRRDVARMSETAGLTLEKHVYCTLASNYIDRLVPLGGPLSRLLDHAADKTWLSWPGNNLIVRLRMRRGASEGT